MIYSNAFTNFRADLVCTYRRSGFECDLVFHQQPPTPDQFGLDNTSSTLQLITEFFNTQDPQQIPGASDEWLGLQDSTLKFGRLTMTQGKAFAVKSTNAVLRIPNASPQTPVYKRWLHVASRTFLVEEVPLVYLADDLDVLPLTASITSPGSPLPASHSQLLMASNQRVFPPAHGVVADTNQILVAAAGSNQEPGVVLDYLALDEGISNFTFAQGVTYFISGVVSLEGTNTFAGSS